MPDVKTEVQKQILKAQESLAGMEEAISKAQSAGIDVTTLEVKAAEYRSQINRLRRVYGV